MKRRSFLRHASHAMVAPGLLGSMGFTFSESKLISLLRNKSDGDKILVLIYLQGGNDGLNTLIPLDQLSALHKVRPHIILPDEKILTLEGTSSGLHPALSGFRNLYNDGKLGIIQSVGYQDQSYSHFRSADIWMSGSAADTLVTSGWSGRFLSNDHPGFPEGYPNDTDSDPLALEIGYGSSLLFQGPTASMSTVISNPDSFYQLIDGSDEPVPDTDAGDKLKYVRSIKRQSQLYGQVLKEAATKISNQKPYPETSLAQQLKIVSRLISGGLKTTLYLVRLGSFDTHVQQVEQNDHTLGTHADLLGQLNDAIVAFQNDLEFQGVADRVVGMTFSEFGRRIISNSSKGTDHGAAAPMFVFGNKVKGGILGSNPAISESATYKDNLEVQYDFRQIYGSVMQQWLAASSSDISEILFENFDSVPVIQQVVDIEKRMDSAGFSVYPNPVVDHATVEFIAIGKPCYIDVIDLQGRSITVLYKGNPAPGKQVFPWDASSLKQGRYFLRFNSKDRKSRASSFIKL
jgi:uncharacterized protein (DUF1501 family)